MISLEKLAHRIDLIESRNKRVEKYKKWETSLTRKLLIILFTYLSIGIYMYAINIDRPLLNAIIPTLGFTLSTLSLTWFRKIWEKVVN